MWVHKMNAPKKIAADSLQMCDLEAIGKKKITALNSLYTSGGCKSGDYELHWQRSKRQTFDYWVRLECGEQQLWLGIAAATMRDDIDFVWHDFTDPARLIAWCASYSHIVELMQSIFECDWIPTEITSAIATTDKLSQAGFVVRRKEQCVAVGCVSFDAESIAPVTLSNASEPADELRRLPVSIPIVVDRAVLTVNELQSLEIGAVMCINRRAFLDIGATLRLTLGDEDLLVKVTGSKLTVINRETTSARTYAGEGNEQQ